MVSGASGAWIQSYKPRPLNRSASTTDFRRAMEEASGLDLESFFDQWLYQGGNPRLEGWWDYDPTARAVRIEIHQTQDAGPLFELPLELGIYYEGDVVPWAVETVQVERDFHRFLIPVEGEPEDVRLDPDMWTLFQSNFGRRGR